MTRDDMASAAPSIADAPVLHHRADGVGVIRLNRPRKRNAMNPEMFALFNAAMASLQSDAEVKAILILAAGPDFCAGGDLTMIDEANSGRIDADTLDLDFFQPGLVTKPIVCGIGGACVGEGVAMALASDLVVCGRSARFVLPEVGIGIAPVDIPLLAARRLAANHIFEALVTGEWKDSGWAGKVGLVNRVVDDAQVEAEAVALAEKIAALPADVVGLVKSFVYGARSASDPAAFRDQAAGLRSRLRRGMNG